MLKYLLNMVSISQKCSYLKFEFCLCGVITYTLYSMYVMYNVHTKDILTVKKHKLIIYNIKILGGEAGIG